MSDTSYCVSGSAGTGTDIITVSPRLYSTTGLSMYTGFDASSTTDITFANIAIFR